MDFDSPIVATCWQGFVVRTCPYIPVSAWISYMVREIKQEGFSLC